LKVFAAFGLVGPAIRVATWPFAWSWDHSSYRSAEFVYELLFCLWAAGWMVAYETMIGTPAAVALAIATNVLVFAMFGMAVGESVQRRLGVILAYAVPGVPLMWWAFWGAGYDLEHLQWPPLLTAMVLLIVPVRLV